MLCPDKFFAFISRIAVKCVIKATSTNIMMASTKPSYLTENGMLRMPAPMTVLMRVTVVRKKSRMDG